MSLKPTTLKLLKVHGVKKHRDLKKTPAGREIRQSLAHGSRAARKKYGAATHRQMRMGKLPKTKGCG